MIQRVITLILLSFSIALNTLAQTIDPENIPEARNLLKTERLRIQDIKNPEERIQGQIETGLKEEAKKDLALIGNNNASRLIKAEYFFWIKSYTHSQVLVDSVLENQKSNYKALELKSRLYLESGQFELASLNLLELMNRNPKNMEAKYDFARNFLKEGILKQALYFGNLLKEKFPSSSLGYRVLARIALENQNGRQADSIIRAGLLLNPLDPELRTLFGYRLWIKDPILLRNKALDQWFLALEINPFLSETHRLISIALGPPEEVNPSLNPILSGWEKDMSHQDFQKIYSSAKLLIQFPKSSIIPLYMGSAYYMGSNLKSPGLDSALFYFEKALDLNPKNGYAHASYAMALESQHISYLGKSDSLFNQEKPDPALLSYIAQEPERFGRLFSLSVRNIKEYLPLLQKLGSSYTLAPLYRPILNSEFLLWDGSTLLNLPRSGLKPVELRDTLNIGDLIIPALGGKNALLESNSRKIYQYLLSEKEKNRIHSLWLKSCLKNKRILPSENEIPQYFSNAYSIYSKSSLGKFKPYFSNEKEELKVKDPELFGFLDSLNQIQHKSPMSSSSSLRDNWAEAYIHLSESILPHATSYKSPSWSFLDTAAQYNPDYLPLIIAKADRGLNSGDLDGAEQFLKKGEVLDPNNSTIFERNYELNKALNESGLLEYSPAYELEKSYLLKAVSLEKEPRLRRNWMEELIQFYQNNAHAPDQIRTMDQYLNENPRTLEEQIRNNHVFAQEALLKLELGYDEGLIGLEKLHQSDPENLDISLPLALSYQKLGKLNLANQVLEKSLPIHQISPLDHEFILQTILISALSGNLSRALELKDRYIPKTEDSSLLQVQEEMALGEFPKAEKLLYSLKIPLELYGKSQMEEIKGDLSLKQNHPEDAIKHYQLAIGYNAYNFECLSKLYALFKKLNRETDANNLLFKLNDLEIKPGPILGPISKG